MMDNPTRRPNPFIRQPEPEPPSTADIVGTILDTMPRAPSVKPEPVESWPAAPEQYDDDPAWDEFIRLQAELFREFMRRYRR